jgi:hypothetical protein
MQVSIYQKKKHKLFFFFFSGSIKDASKYLPKKKDASKYEDKTRSKVSFR